MSSYKREIIPGVPILLLLAICMVGCSRTPEAREQSFMERGNQLFAKKDYARALIEYKNASAVQQQDAEPYYRVALVYLQMDKPTDAFASLLKATQLNPKHSEAQFKLAQLMAVSTDKRLLRDAEKRLGDITANSPGNVEALDSLALSEWALNKPLDAAEHLQQALKQSPGHLMSAVTLARFKLQEHDVSGAEEVLIEAVSQAPQSVEAQLALAQFHLLTEKIDEAQRQVTRALELDPKERPGSDFSGGGPRSPRANGTSRVDIQTNYLPCRTNSISLFTRLSCSNKGNGMRLSRNLRDSHMRTPMTATFEVVSWLLIFPPRDQSMPRKC